MSLTTCLRKAGEAINPDDRKAILARAAELRKSGSDPDSAARQAVDEQLQVVRSLIDKAAMGEADEKPAAPDKIDDVGEKIGGARKDMATSGTSRPKRSDSADDRPAWARRFQISQIVTPGGMIGEIRNAGRWVISDTRSLDWMKQPKRVGAQTFATKEEAEAFVPIAAVGLKHRPAPTRDGKYEIWRDITDRKRVKVVDRVFDTRDEAMRYMAENAAAIIETNTTFGEADIPLPPNRARTGPARREGDVTGDDFLSAFALRGVEFGNWNNQDERQNLMNEAWDGLMDLADVLGVPPRAIGLDGELALAFGARGHGLHSARAHYEHERAVINLTKEKGAGTLAHEWLHALDHYLGRQDGKASSTWTVNKDGTRSLKSVGAEMDMVSSGFSRGERSNARAELRDAFNQVMQTIAKRAEAYVADTVQADKFVGRAREDLARELQGIRRELADQKDVRYYKRFNKPASADLLAEFDAITARAIEGEQSVLATDWRTIDAGGNRAASRWTNETLERLSAIYKEVRGRSGFNAERNGLLDRLRNYMAAYEQRLKMLAEAQSGAEKQRAVPTQFVMDAKELDQGRGENYWTTPHELAARAFQAYVEDKIASGGNVSRFLNYAPESAMLPTPWGFKRIYPAGEERQAINAAFDAFVDAIRTRETDKGVAIFSRTGGAQAKRADESTGRRSPGLPIQIAQRYAAAYEAAGLQRVNVAKNINELPSDLRKKLSGFGDDVRGAYFPREDEIWVFSDKVNSPDQLAFVALHEAFHRGLGHIFGDSSKRLLRQMYATNKRLRDRADLVAAELNVDKDTAIEEALADMAGEGQAQSLRGWSRLAAMIRDWLNSFAARAGLSMRFTNAQIESFVAAVARAGISTNPDARSRADGFDPGEVRVFKDGDLPAAASMAKSPERNALDALAENDELFSLPKSSSTTVEQIARDIDPQITVSKRNVPGEQRYDLTMPNGKVARLMIRKPNPYGPSLYGFDQVDGELSNVFEGRPGENPQDVDPETEDVYIDASLLESGGAGAKVYQIAATFAHNTGRIFIGDPAGLSDEALRRRSEQMLSSALKFGTTSHLAPHPRQTAGDPALGVPPLKWVYGDDIGNIRRLIDVNLKALENAGIDEITFDADAGQFLDSDQSPLDRSGIEALARAGYGRVALAGGSTIARGAVLRALLRREGEGLQGTDGRRLGLLEQLAKLGSDTPAPVADIFYSRGTSFPKALDQRAIRDTIMDRLSNAGEKVSWWDKTLGTQYAKAQKHAEFRPVFESVQSYIEDTSAFANEAADFAPGILPKLESLRDVFEAGKRGLSKADAEAVSAPIFEGTLNLARRGGRLVDLDALVAEAAKLTTEQKAQQLLADRLVSEAELKRWQATPLDIYDGAVRNRYEREYLQAGVVFTRQELRERYRLTEPQIEQYEQFRAAVNASLDQVVASDALRLLGDPTPELRRMAVESRAELRAAIEQHLTERAASEEDQGRRDQITATWNDIAEKYANVDRLKRRGYAPLMRFGKYLVSVKSEGGQQEFFGLYETKAEANRMARDLGADPEFAGRVEQGVMSQEAYKLFSGVPVDSLEMFADALGTEQNAVFQEWLRLTKNNRSALKRLIKRKGIAGFSEDVTRVLASFVTSNARMAAGALNMGPAKAAAQDIRSGDLKDEAVKLIETVQNPQETAGAARGLMFVHFIGGSIASALVNTTQPLMMTLPYLSQWGGATKAAGRLLASARMAASGKIADQEMAAALKRAEQDGIVSPQEIHHLTAEAMATFGKQPVLKRLAFLWAAPFSVAEQFNRRVSFLAAYQTAKAEGIRDPFEFARQTITETQGLYNKGNAPNLTRNAIGATALTFKQYSIHYLEWLGRMWNAGEPGSVERANGRRAVLLAMALLLAAGGTEGLPFAEDLNDLFDTFMQSAGFDTSARGWKREFLANTLGLGDMGADVAQRGLSALPGIPLDVSIRMGMGNLVPGTGMLLKSNTDVSRDVLELAGPAGSLINQYKDAGRKALDGDLPAAALGLAPVALQNVGKAASMWINGEARDTKGRKVMETDEVDALMKLMGFQPASVARESAALNLEQRRIQLARNVESQIADLWAQGVRERDADTVAEARQQLAEWNEANPQSRIVITSSQIKRRVKEMQAGRSDRFERTAPKEMRQSVAEALR